MYYITGSSGYHNSYGSANQLDIWNQNNGYTPAEVAGYGGISGVGVGGVGRLRSDTGLGGLGGLGGVQEFIAGLGSGGLLLAGGLVLFAYLSTRNDKKSKVKAARESYQKRLKEIDDEYGRFGLKKFGRT